MGHRTELDFSQNEGLLCGMLHVADAIQTF